MPTSNQTSTAQIDITEADLKGSCPRLNRKFDLMETQITQVQQSVSASGSTTQPTGSTLSNPMTGTGDMISGGIQGAPARVAANITTTRKFLREQGSGAIGNPPAFDTLVAADIPSLSATYGLVGFPGSYASLVSTGNSGTLAAMNVQHAAAVLPAGIYFVMVNIAATASGGSITLTGAITYTDPKAGGTTTITVPALTTSTNGVTTLAVPINADGAQNLTIAVTKTGGGTASYDVKVYAVRIA